MRGTSRLRRRPFQAAARTDGRAVHLCGRPLPRPTSPEGR